LYGITNVIIVYGFANPWLVLDSRAGDSIAISEEGGDDIHGQQEKEDGFVLFFAHGDEIERISNM
jgi:hypothetical protein